MQNGKVQAQDLGVATASPGAPARPAAWRVVWDFWKAYGEKTAFYQTTVILGVIYVVIVGPIAAIGRLTGHQFLPRFAAGAPSFWHPAQMGRIAGIEELKKQG